MVHFIPPDQRRLAMLASQADSAPALICGSDGTGKGAIARWIHANGARAAQPFITVSYKGKASVAALIQQAQGGTLVVSEVGEWPLSEQLVLLQYIKTKTIPHTDAVPMMLNVRIIATTSQSLEGRAQGGLFNVELLEKLNVFRIEMPPLAKRSDEFDDIVIGLVSEITRELHKEHLRGLADSAWQRLRDYAWPGNLRELRNVLRISVIAAQGDLIDAADLPDFGHDRMDFRATREQFEKVYLHELLKTYDWEIERTCAVARMDRDALVAKIRQYGLTSSAGIRAPEPSADQLS